MNRLFLRCFLPSLMLVLTGCQHPMPMPEPPLPSLPAEDYRVKSLSERNPRYAMAFDYSGCVEDAVISSCGFSGKTSIYNTFGVRKIIEREFGNAAKANFLPIGPGQRADGIVYVETEKLLVTKSWARYTAVITFDIEVYALMDAGRRLIFRKKYRVSNSSTEKSGDTVPICVYSSVQQAVKCMIEDLALCHDIANFVKKTNK